MQCSKIGGKCPYYVSPDNSFVFVMMPFEEFNSVYDAIQQAVQSVDKELKCERADDKYTNFSIWCNRICKNIRKAKYLIVDTTGRNPNVFYELGFSHATENTMAIIITQDIKDAPFDISDINHIIYSEKDLPALREEIKKAILSLESDQAEGSYINKSPDEVIVDLKSQLRAEEKRTTDFKKELIETENRETKLKDHIKELESIQNNPEKEAENKIVELEGTIAELKTKSKFSKDDKKEIIEQLTETLREKEEKLKILEEKLNSYKTSKNVKPLSDLLLDDAKKRSEAEKWFAKGCDMAQKGNDEEAIQYYSKAIELDPNSTNAYNNRGNSYNGLKQYERAVEDLNKAIELDPNCTYAYNNRGLSYNELKQYERAVEDLNKAIELDPNLTIAYNNRGNSYSGLKQHERAVEDYNKAIELDPKYTIAYNNRGNSYSGLKQYERAVEDLNKAIELDPNLTIAYLNLSEVTIITGDYKSALNGVTKALSLSSKICDRVICLYLEGIAKRMLNMDISECEMELNKILEKDFTNDWSFNEIESWSKEADIPDDAKRFIIEKTEMLKKHKSS